MTGKELKRFAELLHDDAEVQVNWGDGYRTEWKMLLTKDIQGTLSPVAFSTQEPKP